jgi:hypothetical protein
MCDRSTVPSKLRAGKVVDRLVTILVPLLVVASFAACSQKQEVPKQGVACNSDDSKSVVTSILKDAIVKQITSDFAAQTDTARVHVTGSLICATVDKIAISLEDVLANKSDPNSTKKFCQSTLKMAVPADVVSKAEAARSMLSLTSSRGTSRPIRNC